MEIPNLNELENYNQLIDGRRIMDTDLCTVHKEDVLELVADIMDWRKLRYMPVENSKGELVGLITSKLLLKHFTKRASLNTISATIVEDIMVKDPITVASNTNIREVVELMDKHHIGAIPEVRGKELIGIITETDLIQL